jgi:hypothetical protein
MEQLRYSESIHIARSPDTVYDLVSDVTRTGEWSPICQLCWWEDDRRGVGAFFLGRNRTPDRTWETRSQVVVAERGREFAWQVGIEPTWAVRWGYRLAADNGGTRLTEDWEFLPDGYAVFSQRYGERAPDEIAERTQAARQGIPETLVAIKRVAESD